MSYKKELVMNDNNIDIDSQSKKLLREHGLLEPGRGFTSSLMARIATRELYSIKNYKPVIGRKVFALIGLGYFLLMLFLFISPAKDSADGENTFFAENMAPYLTNLTEFAGGVFSGLEFDPLIPLILITVWLLYLLDRFLRRRIHD